MKLMIVDDHSGVRALIRELAAPLATGICECANGEEALRQYPEFQPDYVTMDLQMPDMDGFETTRRMLAADPRARVIVVSHLKHAALAERARSAGACLFVPKECLMELQLFLNQTTQCPKASE